MKFKVGDKVLYKDGKYLKIFEIGKISKNEKYFLPKETKTTDRSLENIIYTRKQLKDFLLEQADGFDNSYIGFLNVRPYFTSEERILSVLKPVVSEDLYDDSIHIRFFNEYYSWRYDTIENVSSKEDLEDCYIFPHINYTNLIFTKNIDCAIEYIITLPIVFIDKEENNLLEKYNKWVGKEEDKIPTDWNGETKQLVYCIENDVSPLDYITWQKIEKFLQRELSLKSALELFDIFVEENVLQ